MASLLANTIILAYVTSQILEFDLIVNPDNFCCNGPALPFSSVRGGQIFDVFQTFCARLEAIAKPLKVIILLCRLLQEGQRRQ